MQAGASPSRPLAGAARRWSILSGAGELQISSGANTCFVPPKFEHISCFPRSCFKSHLRVCVVGAQRNSLSLLVHYPGADSLALRLINGRSCSLSKFISAPGPELNCYLCLPMMQQVAASASGRSRLAGLVTRSNNPQSSGPVVNGARRHDGASRDSAGRPFLSARSKLAESFGRLSCSSQVQLQLQLRLDSIKFRLLGERKFSTRKRRKPLASRESSCFRP